MDAGTGLLICCAGLWAVVGWTAHAWLSEWERSHKVVKLDVPILSPYERALKTFDDRIAQARAKHRRTQPIMDEKADFVKAQLQQSYGQPNAYSAWMLNIPYQRMVMEHVSQSALRDD